MLRKTISFCLAMMLVIAFTAGCGSSAPAPAADAGGQEQPAASDTPAATPEPTGDDTAATGDKPYDGTTIRFTMQKYGTVPTDQENILKELSAEFYEKTGITVDWSIVDWDQAQTKLTLAMSPGGDAPDVADIFMTPSWLAIGGEERGPIIVDDIIEEIGEDTFFELGAYEAKINGHWYGLPWRADTRILMYNKEHFEEAGITKVPETWDELIDTAKKLTQKDDKGNITRAGMLWFVSNGRFDQTWNGILEGAGGSIMNADYTAPAFNSPEGKESLQFMRDAIFEYGVMPQSIIDPSFDVLQEFMAGKASIVYSVTVDAKRNIETQAPQMIGKIGGAVMPSKTGQGNSSVVSSAPFSILATSQHIDASKEWLRFLGNPANMVRLAKAVTLLNSSRIVMEDPFYSDDEWYQAAVAQFDRGGPMDQPVPQFGQMASWPNGPLPKLATNVVGGKDIQESLDAAEKEVIELLKQ